MEQAIAKLCEHAPWAVLFIIAVKYLVSKLEKKEKEIERLNALLLTNQKEETDASREREKESIETMNELNTTLKDMIRYGKK